MGREPQYLHHLSSLQWQPGVSVSLPSHRLCSSYSVRSPHHCSNQRENPHKLSEPVMHHRFIGDGLAQRRSLNERDSLGISYQWCLLRHGHNLAIVELTQMHILGHMHRLFVQIIDVGMRLQQCIPELHLGKGCGSVILQSILEVLFISDG